MCDYQKDTQIYTGLIKYIITLKKGYGNPIWVSMICSSWRGLPICGCCKSWTQGWDSLIPSQCGIIFLPCLLFLTRGSKGHISCTWVQCATFLTDRPGQQFLFTHQPKKHKLGRRRWDLASCQVSLNSVQPLQRRSRITSQPIRHQGGLSQPLM